MKSVLMQILIAAFTGGILLAVFQYWADRKTRKARVAVATATVTTQVELAELGTDSLRLANVERRMSLLADAHEQERLTWQRALGNVREELANCRIRIDHLEVGYRASITYIRELRLWGRTVAPDAVMPPVPAAVDMNE